MSSPAASSASPPPSFSPASQARSSTGSLVSLNAAPIRYWRHYGAYAFRTDKLNRGTSLSDIQELTMRMESRPSSDYTRTWTSSGKIEYAKLADGTRLRYLKEGSGPTVLIVLHTVRTQLDHFQLVIPKISHAFTVYAIDMPGMGWSDIRPGASYTEPALRRAIVGFVTTLDLNDVTLAGESMGATVSLTASTELEDPVRRVVAFNTYDYSKGVGEANLALLRDAQSIALPDSGHFAALEEPARVAEILLDNHRA